MDSQMADIVPIYPAFFRIFLSEHHSEKMKVPPEFLKYLEEDSLGNVILIGSSGYQWQVTIFKDEKVYMQTGWPQVLADNSVKSKELLLFTYNGQNRFLVQFFSCNGCERQCIKTIKHEEAATPNLVTTRKRGRGRPRKEQKGLPTTFLNHMKECGITKECEMKPAKKYPDFFKVFLPERHSERMLIPNAFVKLARQQGWEPRDIILKNRYGIVWEVKAVPIDNQLYFDAGWKQFREDNCLQAANFVFFTYVESIVFNFKICESTGCERTKVNNRKEQEKEREDVIELAEEEEEDEDDDDYEYDEDEDEDGVDDVEYDDDVGYNNDEEEEEDTEMEEEDEEEAKETMRRQSPGKACKINLNGEKGGSSGTKIQPLPDDLFGLREKGGSSETKIQPSPADLFGLGEKEGSLGTKAEDAEHNEIDAEMYIQPENPYFPVKLWKTRPNDLHIPYTILKDFSPWFGKKVTLVCCQCQNVQRNELRNYHLSLHEQQTPISRRHKEEGEVARWRDGRVCVKGWVSFSRKNKIKENDACFCEIVWQEDKAIEMIRVHVAKK